MDKELRGLLFPKNDFNYIFQDILNNLDGSMLGLI